MVIVRLTIRNLAARKIRTALTVAAIVAAVSLVVSVTSGYASVEAAAQRFLTQYVASSDAQITRSSNEAYGGVPDLIIDQMARTPGVLHAIGRLEMTSTVMDADEKLATGRVQVLGIRRPDDTRVDSLQLTAGSFFNSSTGDVAVIDQAVADRLKVGVGDVFELPGSSTKLKLTVSGIVHKPDILAAAQPTIYVPLTTLQQFTAPQGPAEVTRVLIDLLPGTDGDAFAEKARKILDADRAKDASLPVMAVRMIGQSRAELDRNLIGLHVASYLAGGVSLLTAAFIIFSVLSMGVTERQRTLAMLRAVGTTRSQLVRLVMLEGMLLAVAGILIGVPLGWGWVAILYWKYGAVFRGGLVLSGEGIAVACAAAMVAAALASLLPAWMAARVSPMEAISILAQPPPRRPPLGWAAIGLGLAAIDPVLQYIDLRGLAQKLGAANPDSTAVQIRLVGHFGIGLPGIVLGFFLVSPLLVWMIERSSSAAVALVLRLPKRILRDQLGGRGGSGWRSAGTATALMIGLATLVAMQTQGRSLLGNWQLPDRFPDIFLASFNPSGLGPDEIAKLSNIPGIRKGELMPVATAAPGLGGSFLVVASAALTPNSTLFIGAPPEQVFRMISLDFRDDQGREVPPARQVVLAQRAEKLISQGHWIVVTDEFRQAHGAAFGDVMKLRRGDGTEVEYRIAGIVWSPGIDVFKSVFDMGHLFDQRTTGTVFGSIDDARRDFGARGIYLFAANLEPGFDRTQLMKEINENLGAMNMRAGDVRSIKFAIETGFGRLLMLMTSVSVAAMAVASLGVTNTVMASIRSRRWQFGILRGIGATRGLLMRLVLAEACLLGLAGALLGIGCGAELTWMGRVLSRSVLGTDMALVIPWRVIAIGAGSVVAVAVLASVAPAVALARARPLALLQEGRSAS